MGGSKLYFGGVPPDFPFNDFPRLKGNSLLGKKFKKSKMSIIYLLFFISSGPLFFRDYILNKAKKTCRHAENNKKK